MDPDGVMLAACDAWRALPFTPLAPAEQGRCLGSAYAACPHFPPSTSMLRRLTLAAGGLAR